MRNIFLVLSILISINGFSQDLNNVQLSHMQKPSVRHEIKIPDILGFKTYKCDFHMHTIFSDGVVWPEYRVIEAWEEGLDAIAITDHIENQPSKKYVGGDHNASYEIALPKAKEKDILLVRAGEITRSMPPGHLNALFLEDVNPLDTKKPIDAIKAAKKQNAFILWNHPGWKAQQPDTCLWMPMHQELYKKGLIHGIEVFNEKEWYPIALDWCIDKKLSVFGNSDIHGISANFYDLEKGHRPMTLVFAKERTLKSLKEAMFAQRTVAFFDGKLAGKEEFLKAIFNASLQFKTVKLDDNRRHVKIINSSDIPFLVGTKNGGHELLVPDKGEIMFNLPRNIEGPFIIKNLFVGSTKNLEVDIDFQ